jgi:flavin reductase (DIM6/NTAB) family NADH-FMN oxidoreductase RutF
MGMSAIATLMAEPSQKMMIEDGRQLRDSFGSFATGVVIVTATCRGERIGSTISSFNSVSLNPPLVSFCIARNAKAIDIWRETASFAVSVLAHDQAELSTRFARSLGDKWTGVSTRRATCIDAELIDGALMWFECETYARYDGGDHIVILGRVVEAMRNASATSAPLLFFGGAYRHLAARTQDEPILPDAMWPHAW